MWLPLVALQRAVATYSLAAGGCPLRSQCGQEALAAWPLAAAPCGLAAVVRACGAAATVGGALAGGLAAADHPLAAGRSPLQGGWPEIVYLCIPDPDGKDEGGPASSSLAVSTRWISIAKLLQSDLATLAQREGGD
ncbi:hypothetical protein GW17_00043584 [Ensete ventricosum]|nr:hypothetical protein GW17_00043584 [Ensete ventricosum]